MKSTRIEHGKIKIVNVKKPELNGYGAIIKVEGCGLCGSDIVKIKARDESAVLGHEIVGTIVEINTDTAFKVNDRVVMGHHYPCMECDFCKSESYSMCERFKNTNISPCGFSEYIYATEGHLKNTVIKISKSSDPIVMSFLEPLACCIRAVNRAALKPHQNALVIGLGSIGLLMAQAIKVLGNAAHGTDIREDRQVFAHKLDITMDDSIKYDSVFMTSGSSKALSDALKYVKDGGKIIVFSSIENKAGYTNNDIYYRELTVIGSYSPSPKDLRLSHKFLSDKVIKVDGISTIYPLDNLEQAVDDTVTNKIFKAYIKICA